RAIQVHPLVCAAYNADFDGDQMAVHLPLSAEAQAEARVLMLSTHNLLNPKDGKPVVAPTQDMVLGCYYLTLMRDDEPAEGREVKAFSSADEVLMAYESRVVGLHEPIKVRVRTGEGVQVIETTPGRIIFNESLPEELRFINRVVDQGELRRIVAECYRRLGFVATATMLDHLKELGFHFATQAGTTMSVDDVHIPAEKQARIEAAERQVEEVEQQYQQGLITREERYQKVIDIWTAAKDEITDLLRDQLDPFNPIRMMAISGARGNWVQISQLGGMRGLMADPSGRTMEIPVRANFREGLT